MGVRWLWGMLCALPAAWASARELPALSWLRELEPILTAEERILIERLEPPWRREAFAQELLQALDPYPETALNEPLELWKAQIARLNETFPTPGWARTVTLLLGQPSAVTESRCPGDLLPWETWSYSLGGSKQLRVFWHGVRPELQLSGWEVTQEDAPLREPDLGCKVPQPTEPLGSAFRQLLEELGKLAAPSAELMSFYQRLLPPPLSEPAPLAQVRLLERFVDGSVRVALELSLPEVPPASGVWVDGQLLSASTGSAWERFSLWVRKPSAPSGSKWFQVSLERHWPKVPAQLVLRWSRDPEGTAWERSLPLEGLAREANEDFSPLLRLFAPVGQLVRGRIPVRAEVWGGAAVARVEFLVDGKPVLSRTRPPYAVDLELGTDLRPRRLQARALDAAGRELDRAERWVNVGLQRIELQFWGSFEAAEAETNRTRFSAHVEYPSDRRLEGVDFYLAEDRVATLDCPPFRLELAGEHSRPPYLKAVLRLSGIPPLERVTAWNPGSFGESLDVDFVELFVSATNRRGEPIAQLAPEDLELREDRRIQRLARVEKLKAFPVSYALLLDTSASMAEELPTLEQAALRFFERVLRPSDRAVVIAFGDEVTVATPPTSRLEVLAGALTRLLPRGGTRLYDALAEGLFQTAAVPTQRALLLFTDGVDAGSELSFSQVFDYALRVGTPIYVLGLGVPSNPPDVRNRLEQLARATGGRCFFFERVGEADRIYRQIEQDLESFWLVAYQSDAQRNTGSFREVEVKTRRPGIRLRAPRGYFP